MAELITKKGSEKDTELGYAVLEYAVKGFTPINLAYRKSIEYFLGKHKISDNDEKKGNRVYNKYGEIFENRVSHLTEALPDFQFTPQEETDIWKADALNQVIGDVIFRNWQEDGEQSVSEAAHAGSSIIKTNYNKTNGHPVFTVIPCGQGIPDPVAKKPSENRFFIHAYPMNPKDIKTEFKFDVTAERYLDVYNPTMTLDVLKSWEKHSNSAPSDVFDENDTKGLPLDSPGKIGQALVIEVWLDDDTMETIPFDAENAAKVLEALKIQKVGVDPEDNHVQAIAFFEEALKAADPSQPTYVQNLMDHLKLHYEYPLEEMRKKYPYGKVIFLCQGNSKAVANPLKIAWRDVFIMWDYFPHPQRLFGKGLGVDLIAPQDTVNHRINAITKNINNLNNGVILMKQGVINALVKMKDNLSKLTNAIGLTIPVTDVTRDFRRDFGPALGNQHFAEVGFHLDFMDKKSGQNDLRSGVLPPGSPAGVTVEALLGESQKPINSVIRRYSWALKKMAENAVKIMINFMDEDEIFSILVTSDDTFNQQYKNIRWAELKDTIWKDIRVDITGQMASTRTRKFTEAIQLMQFGVYKPEDVLDAIDDPKKYKIKQRDDMVKQLTAMLDQINDQNKALVTEVKTLRNRQQGDDGKGNTGQESNKSKK